MRIDFRDKQDSLHRVLTITHARGSRRLIAVAQITRLKHAEIPVSEAVAEIIRLLEPIGGN